MRVEGERIVIAVFDTNIVIDAIIWATAKVYDTVLVTRNTKEFDAAWEGIRVPYQLSPG